MLQARLLHDAPQKTMVTQSRLRAAFLRAVVFPAPSLYFASNGGTPAMRRPASMPDYTCHLIRS